MNREHDFRVVNHSVRKIDSLGLSTGKRAFTDDIHLPGMLHVRILRSPHAHANIRAIDCSKAEALQGVHAVVHYGNTPRVLHTTAGQGYPEPSPYDTAMFNQTVRFAGERVAAVAAETEEIADAALKLIDVDYEELEPVFDPEAALQPGAPIIHDEPDCLMPIPVDYLPKQNIAAQSHFMVGDIETGLAEADYTYDNRYECHYTSHAAIEPHSVIAWLDADNRLIIRTSTQVPFHVRRIAAQVLQIPVGRIRVIKPRIGGGFGGKQEVFLEVVAGILALRTNRPVRLILSRAEVFTAARTRHPQVIRLRTGVKKDGAITAISLDTIMNTGAYGSHALTVVMNTGSKVLPILNKTPNVEFRGRTVYTNLPIGGAYRGYGATQGAFALGVQMDEMARDIGWNVVDLWRKNHIRQGETSPVFKALGEGREGVEMIVDSCGLEECINIGLAESGFEKYYMKNVREGSRAFGAGMVCLMQGSSIPEVDMASATMKMNEDGSFNLLIGATDLGTGSDTVMAQIAAEVLGIPVGKIIVYSSDTDLTPFDVGAYASSTTYLSGEAVRRAAHRIRDRIIQAAGDLLQVHPDRLVVSDGAVGNPDSGETLSYEDIAVKSLYSTNQHQIQAEASAISHKSPPPFSAHFAVVSVDLDTGELQVHTYVAAVDCGTAINPTLAEGQVEGAVMNAISSALWENYEFTSGGRMKNTSFSTYKIGTMRDLPDLKAIIVPTYEKSGPFGAKSVSEICTNGPMPVLSNAIYDAVGVRLRCAPFTNEKIFNALKGQGE